MIINGERGWERDKLGVWDQQIQTTTCKTDKQRTPTGQHKEVFQYPINIINHNGKEYEKEYIYMYN